MSAMRGVETGIPESVANPEAAEREAEINRAITEGQVKFARVSVTADEKMVDMTGFFGEKFGLHPVPEGGLLRREEEGKEAKSSAIGYLMYTEDEYGVKTPQMVVEGVPVDFARDELIRKAVGAYLDQMQEAEAAAKAAEAAEQSGAEEAQSEEKLPEKPVAKAEAGEDVETLERRRDGLLDASKDLLRRVESLPPEFQDALQSHLGGLDSAVKGLLEKSVIGEADFDEVRSRLNFVKGLARACERIGELRKRVTAVKHTGFKAGLGSKIDSAQSSLQEALTSGAGEEYSTLLSQAEAAVDQAEDGYIDFLSREAGGKRKAPEEPEKKGKRKRKERAPRE